MLRLFSCHPQRQAVLDADRDYERVDFNIHTPTYSVKYLGYEKLFKAGLPEICGTVRTLYVSQKSVLKSLNHYSLKLTKQELSLRDKHSTEDEEKVFALRRIQFCGVLESNQKIFFYNYQFGPKGDALDCHAVLCTNKLEAKSLAKVISTAFKEAQHEAHQMDIASRRLHAQGLSENSISRLHEDTMTNVEVNKRYYNCSFKNSRSNSGASSSYFRSINSRTPEGVKGSNTYCHLGASIEWERTESSLDNAGHSDSADAEKTSTSGDEVFGCSCEKNCLINGESNKGESQEMALHQNEPNVAAMIQNLPRSFPNSEEDLAEDSEIGRKNRIECDWSKVFTLEETEI